MESGERQPVSSLMTDLRAKLPAAFSLGPGLLAILIILWVAFVFCRPILKFNDELVPQGLEFEPNSGLISPAYSSLREHGEFPFWKPYVDTGVPYLGDPANYLLNPLGSVAALILGPVNGPKGGILLAVAFSGFSAYYLASVLGLCWPARVWAAVLLGLNGHLVARISAGQFQPGIAFPLIAFSLAAMPPSTRAQAAALQSGRAGTITGMFGRARPYIRRQSG